MSFTNMLLSGGWERSEWPDYIEVAHDVDCCDMRTYVPERTCQVLDGTVSMKVEDGKTYFGKALSCGHLAFGCIPNYCSECGAKVVR